MADKNVKKGRGRGRGRDKPTESDPEPPHPDTIDMLRSTQEVTDEPQPTPEQFSNVTSIPVPPSSEVIGNSLTNDTVDNDVSKTLVGQGKCPPLVAEVKEMVRQGVKTLDPQSPEFFPSPLTFKKIYVNVEPDLLSNGLSDELVDCSRQPDSSLATKQLPVSSFNTLSKLNPFSEQFNPSGLNVAAPEFVPTIPLDVSAQIGSDQLEVDPIPSKVKDELVPFDSLFIIRAFTPVISDDNLEINPIINTAAEVLCKAVMYTGSHKQHLAKLKTVMTATPQSEDVLKNLAEMIVYWGVSDPSFLFIACNMCEVLCDVISFRKPLALRLRVWYIKLTSSKAETEEEKYHLINFGVLLADIYFRVEMDGKEFFADRVFEVVNNLLTLKADETVIGACNILKLTGSLLELSTTAKMDQVMELMKDLSLEQSLSRSCTDVLIRVIQQRARNWCLLSSQTLEFPPPKGLTLNVDAKPFVPSGEFPIEETVSSVDEWNEFETDFSDATQGVVYDYPATEFNEDDLDLDIELEMEAFIEEIEEHLLMQDFDPDIVTDTSSSKQ